MSDLRQHSDRPLRFTRLRTQQRPLQHLLQRTAFVLTLVLALSSVAVFAPSTPAAQAATTASAFDKEVLRLVNAQRTKRGLAKVKLIPTMQTKARSWSSTMARTGRFEHISMSGLTADTRASGCGGAYAENIAYTMGSTPSPSQIVSMYMGSPGHRAAILNKSYRFFASGSYVKGSTVYNTQRFASTCKSTKVKGWATKQSAKLKKTPSDTIKVSGTKRVVKLQQRTSGKWVTVRKFTTSSVGKVKVVLPKRVSKSGKVKFRVAVSAKGTYPAATSKTKVVTYKK